MTDVINSSSPAPDGPSHFIENTPFDSALSERYLVYALSTITARSLPDLRDGLKPVHRRLLWAMRQLKLDPANGYKKSARVVGDVIGKYHPHGDTSVYDAMVRLAQNFALRYPLVDGQGNFGNIDGDNAAAYRYTEAKLTHTAIELMDGLDAGTVDFRLTYNGEEKEPEIMPGLFPNLLANGASGIAVGMATNIPSHNVAEILDAAAFLIEEKEANHEQIMEHIRGPDFATGGILIDPKSVIDSAYASGRGSLRIRARFSTGRIENGEWEPTGVEKLPGGQWQLVVTEIPYQVQKSKLIEQIAQLIIDKKLPILDDIRDESDENIRIVFIPRSRNVDPDDLKNVLFQLSDLENRFALNINVLDADNRPRQLGITPLLRLWVEHQIIILVRRTEHRLEKIAQRLELLDGYIIAYLNLDRVIEIIRYEDRPKPLMIEEFSLTDRQVEAILNMRLRSLRKLEEIELRKERNILLEERERLEKLLASPSRQRARLKKDIATLRKIYGPNTPLGKRRTELIEADIIRDIPLTAMIAKEPITIIHSQKGWIKAIKGHVDLENPEISKFKEGDALGFALHAQTTDRILLAANNGRFFTVGADRLPGGRGFGEPIRSMIDLDADSDIIQIFTVSPESLDRRLFIASSWGRGFIVLVEKVLAETKKGRQVVNLKGDAKLRVVYGINEKDDSVAVIGENRKLVIFPLNELPEMARGQGVLLQRYKDGGLSDARTFHLEGGLSWTMGGEQGRTRTENNLIGWRVARGAAGRLPPTGFPKDNRFT